MMVMFGGAVSPSYALANHHTANEKMLCGMTQMQAYHQVMEDTAPQYRDLYKDSNKEMVEAAYQGNVEGQFFLAMHFHHVGQNYQTSKCLYEMLAKRQDDYAKAAMLKLSSNYEYGFGNFPQDFGKHLYWLEKLAEIKPDTYVRLQLAHSYHNVASNIQDPSGEHIKFFAQKAMFWSLKASQDGSGEGSFIVAQLYASGLGIDQDYQKSIEYYQLAIRQLQENLQKSPSDSSAILNLSIAYTYLGEAYYAIQDYANAKIVFEKDVALSEHHASRSYYGLSLLYRYGHGVLQDVQKADELHKKSCELGFVPACEKSIN